MIITLPISGFVSVVGLAVCGFPGYGVQLAPSVPLACVVRFLFLFGAFLNRYILFHGISFLREAAQTVEK